MINYLRSNFFKNPLDLCEKFEKDFYQERNLETNAWEYTFDLIYKEHIENI
jgi:hypothetical protein